MEPTTKPNLLDEDLLLDNMSWFVRVSQDYHTHAFNRFDLNSTKTDHTTIYDEFALIVPGNVMEDKSQLCNLFSRLVFGYSFADVSLMASPPSTYPLPKQVTYQILEDRIAIRSFVPFIFNYGTMDFNLSGKTDERFIPCQMNGKPSNNKSIVVGFGLTPQTNRLFATVNGILTAIQRPGFEISDMTNENTKGFSFLTVDARKVSNKLPYCKVFKRKREDWVFSLKKNLEYFDNSFEGITQNTITSLQFEYRINWTAHGNDASQKILGESFNTFPNNTSTTESTILGGLICEDLIFNNVLSYLDGFDVMKISYLNKFHFNLITVASYENMFHVSLPKNTKLLMNNVWKQIIQTRWIQFQVFNNNQNFFKIFKRRFVRVDKMNRKLITVDGCARLEKDCPIVLNFASHGMAFCNVCSKNVYQTTDLAQLIKYAKEGLCVSYSDPAIELSNYKGNRTQGCFIV